MLGHGAGAAALARGAGHEVAPAPTSEVDARPIARSRTGSAQLRRRSAPDWVVHLAAFTQVDDCEADPTRAFLVNGSARATRAGGRARPARRCSRHRTDYVFDGDGTRAVAASTTRPRRSASTAAPRGRASRRCARQPARTRSCARRGCTAAAGATSWTRSWRARAPASRCAVVDDQRGSPTWTDDLARALVRLLRGGAVRHLPRAPTRATARGTSSRPRSCAPPGATRRSARDRRAELARPAQRPAYSVLRHGTSSNASPGGACRPGATRSTRYLASSPPGARPEANACEATDARAAARARGARGAARGGARAARLASENARRGGRRRPRRCVADRCETGGTVYFCGNGGSAADAQHLAAELAGRYLHRPPGRCRRWR